MTYIGRRPPQNSFATPGIWTPQQVAVQQQKNLWPPPPDPSLSSVVCLIQPTILDTAYTTEFTGKTIFTVGSVPLVGGSPFEGGAGFSFTGSSSNYLYLSSSADWAKPGDYCIELVVRMASDVDCYLFGRHGGSNSVYFALHRVPGGLLYWEMFLGSSFSLASPACVLPVGVTRHIAVTRSGNVHSIWADGKAVASTTVASGIGTASSAMVIGAGFTAFGAITGAMDGQIFAFRDSKGDPRYTSAFSPLRRPFSTR